MKGQMTQQQVQSTRSGNLKYENLDIALDYIKGKIHDLQIDSEDEKNNELIDSLEDLLSFVEQPIKDLLNKQIFILIQLVSSLTL